MRYLPIRLAAALLVALPLAARGETIMVNSSAGGIYLVDTETLRTEQVTVAPQFYDIAISPNGEIYGITSGGQLWRVDPSGMHVPLAMTGTFVNALTFDPGGALVGAGHEQVVGISVGDGRTRSLGVFPGFMSSGDMAFAPDGALYATGSPGPAYEDGLYRIGADGGGMRLVGAIGFRNVYGLVWSVSTGGLIGVTEARELITIHPATGAGQLMGVLAIEGFGYGAAGLGADNATISRAGQQVTAR